MPGAKEDLETLFARRREIDRALLEQHSRDVAILFTDIVGSTQFFESKGDIAGLERVRRHNELLFPVVQAHSGWIVKTIGDAIMAVFDDPTQAVRCACQMQRVLAEANRDPGHEPLHIRAGLHFGRAIRDGDRDVYGDAVNTAARIVNQARGDEVVVSRALADRVAPEAGLVLQAHGSFQAKGKADPIEVLSVSWQGEAARSSDERPSAAANEVRPDVFVLEIGAGARGLKVAALEGAADADTLKAYADVALPAGHLELVTERFVTFVRGGGTSSYVKRVREMGASLFQTALSEHARARLSATSLSCLRLNVDDHLVGVPWELMHDGREFLALRFAMGRVVNSRAEGASAVRNPDRAWAHALVVSNASGGLEGAVREGEAVTDLLREGYTGEVRHIHGPVKRADFLAALPGCAVLHFAGHIEHPTASSPGGFTLADGVVTPDEVAQSVGAAAPPLVFANGCHASSAEGLRGMSLNGGDLASSLLLAGARHFIGPRWEIADEDALRFALRFYERALAGASFGDAVLQARQALLEPGARPLSFAGYVLYGDPRDGFPSDRARLNARPKVRSTFTGDRFPAVSTKTKEPPRRNRAAIASALGAAGLVLGGGLIAAVLRHRSATDPAVRPNATVAVRASATAAVAGAPAATPSAAAPAPRAGPIRLCVLPFKNISGDEELEFLRDGLTEAVMTDFGGAEGIRLIERAQVELDIQELEFSQTKYVDPQTRAKIGRIEGAEVVVMGGFQRAGQVVRAHARFVDVETGEVLESVRVDTVVGPGASESLFELQDALSARIRDAVPSLVARIRP